MTEYDDCEWCGSTPGELRALRLALDAERREHAEVKRLLEVALEDSSYEGEAMLVVESAEHRLGLALARIERLEEALRDCVAALMRMDIAKPETVGDAQRVWATRSRWRTALMTTTCWEKRQCMIL